MQYFISCDWGTTTLRVRLVEVGSNNIIADISNNNGVAFINNHCLANPKISRNSIFRKTLQDAISELSAIAGKNLEDLTIFISGMASSSIGMKELHYKKIPFDLNKDELNFFLLGKDEEFKNDILLISGLCSTDDVMRGEETQLLGCYSQLKKDGVYIFPGTHSKHVIVANGIVSEIRTFMTGEVFKLLSENSVLSSSIQRPKLTNHTLEENFILGLNKAKKSSFLNAAFKVRINSLFNVQGPEENYYYLSGLLIGEELKNIDINQLHIVVGSGELASLYNIALEIITRKKPLSFDATKALINGQSLINNK